MGEAQGEVAYFGEAAAKLADLSLEVAGNRELTGSLGTGFCKAAGLKYLELSTNSISGSIPTCLLGPGEVHLQSHAALLRSLLYSNSGGHCTCRLSL